MSHSIAPAGVNTSPTVWRGRTVQVTGILAFGSHARHLWTVGRSRNDIDNCLTLVNTYPLRTTLARLHGRRVTVTGVVIEDTWRDADGNDVVDFGSCNRVGLLVKTIEY